MCSINIDDEILELFDAVSEKVYQERKEQIKNDLVIYDEQLKTLEEKENYIISNLDNFLTYKEILEVKNKELEDIKSQKYLLTLKESRQVSIMDIS